MKPALVLIAAAILLAACGKQGALERPPPVFGGGPSPSDPVKEAPRK